MAGGFPLQKWISNDPSILDAISPKDVINLSSFQFGDTMTIHVLGLSWNPSIDSFQFSVRASSPGIITKRTVLSTIARLFDPLGLLAPVVITAKIFIQELWSLKLGWDDSLPDVTSKKWISFIEQLQEITKLTFPRWVGLKSGDTVEVHGFCDASQRALSAVIYIRVSDSAGFSTSQLLCPKTKVAPLKRMTIPRLELTGAVLLTKLTSHVLRTLEITHAPVFLWTDSMITHTWINNHPSRWKEFVQNRVCYIQERIPHAIWNFIPGIENPADCATRGLSPSELLEHALWWSGPCWLSQEPSAWPQQSHLSSHPTIMEERPNQVTVTNLEGTSSSSELWDLIHKYSNLTKLLRITALCVRVIAKFKGSPISSPNIPITTQEIENAKLYWVKCVQTVYFRQELKFLVNEKTLPRSSPLIRLTPIIDSDGQLRVGGRLQASLLPQDAKHPLILPRKSSLTTLVIADAHLRTLHGGTQVTLSYTRDTYWIIGGRAPVRSFTLKCVRCARYRQQRAQQIIGQLPPQRIIPSRPFLNSGVDYAGPFLLKNWRGKNSRTYKSYISLFVCLSTSAIHPELVTDYTADAFIAAYKRFTSRRGICATLSSDCGTNFKGADSELRQLFSASSKEFHRLSALLANDGTQWKFIPPASPHFGGKWEAGVKSVKHHLRRVVGSQLLTYEEMNTLLIQIEAVLNSRPLCGLTNDPDDFSALTPGHFLIGSSLSSIPEPSLKDVKLSHLSRWQLTHQMFNSFWSHWSREYLQRHLAVYKWNNNMPQIQEGTLVLVVDERYPPSKWPLGRILSCHQGKDGRVRVVTVRTQVATLKRSIVKICPLPISTQSRDSFVNQG